MLLDRRAPSAKRVLYASGVVALAIACGGAADLLNRPFGFDLAAYLIAAWNLLAGADIYLREPVLGPFGGFFYPPVIAAAFIPFALDPHAGAMIWRGLLLGIAAAFGWSLVRAHDVPHRPWVAAAFIFFTPLLWDLGLGNVTMLAVACALFAWRMRDRPVVSGALLALSIALKPLAATVLIYLLVSGRWRIAAWALGSYAAAVVTTWPWLGRYWIGYVGLLATLLRSEPPSALNLIPPDLFGLPARVLLPLLAACVAVLGGLWDRTRTHPGHGLHLTLAAGPLVSSTVWYPYLIAALPLLLGPGSAVSSGRRMLSTAMRVLVWAVLVTPVVRSPGFTLQLLGLLALLLLGLVPILGSLTRSRRSVLDGSIVRLAALTTVSFVACTASGPPPAASPAGSASAPPPGPGTQAAFILANSAGLIALDGSCHPLGRVVEIPPQSAAATPGLRTDHKRIAFALTGQPDPKTGFGTDIFEVNIDGTGLHRLVAHEAENVFYDSPRYDPRGDAVYVHKRSAIQRNAQYVGNDDVMERIDLATMQHTAVVHDGMDPTVSSDGTRMTYVHLTNSLPDGLWTVGLPDGSGAHPLLPRDTFTYLQTPRYSPTGSDIVFSAAGHQTSAVGGGREAHLGIPSQLYLASADGAKLTLLGQTLDDVVPAWSPDGTKVAYVGIGSFVIITVSDRSTVVCAQGDQFFFGDPLWLK